jgi:hypothetical protein
MTRYALTITIALWGCSKKDNEKEKTTGAPPPAEPAAPATPAAETGPGRRVTADQWLELRNSVPLTLKDGEAVTITLHTSKDTDVPC